MAFWFDKNYFKLIVQFFETDQTKALQEVAIAASSSFWNTGIFLAQTEIFKVWIPAFAGMTEWQTKRRDIS